MGIELDDGKDNGERKKRLPEDFNFTGYSFRMFKGKFLIIIDESEGTKEDEGEKDNGYIIKVESCPEEDGEGGDGEDKDTAHCGCSGLIEVAIRAIFSDRL